MLSICIPTYNRDVYLLKNLELLKSYIEKNKLIEIIEIVISNNASTDQTFEVLTLFEKINPKLKLKIYNQKSNIGMIKNFEFVACKALNNIFMWLGDDDYISEDYLLKVLDIIERNKNTKEIFSILPSFKPINGNGEVLSGGRGVNDSEQIFEKGFKTCIKNSYKGHQMSGLVFSKNILEIYKERKVNNMYPFIFFVAYSNLNGKTYYIPQYPVKVTVGEKKYWNYGNDGLVSEVFDNYMKLDELSYLEKSFLELYFLKIQSWRYLQYQRKVFYAILNIIKNKNTTFVVKFIFIVLVFYIFIKILIKKMVK